LGRRPLGAILHSSNEPGELSQWLCHDDSTINIVVLIIIIIIIIQNPSYFAYFSTFPLSVDSFQKVMFFDLRVKPYVVSGG